MGFWGNISVAVYRLPPASGFVLNSFKGVMARDCGFGFGSGLRGLRFGVLGFIHRLLNSSFLGLPYRILNMNHKKELLRSLWVGLRVRFPLTSRVALFRICWNAWEGSG